MDALFRVNAYLSLNSYINLKSHFCRHIELSAGPLKLVKSETQTSQHLTENRDAAYSC